MKSKPVLILITALLFLTSLILSNAAASCVTCNNSGGTLDEASGICIPHKIDGLNSITYPVELLNKNKAYRNTVTVGFNGSMYGLIITIYLYDREIEKWSADINELKLSIQEVLSSHSGARLEHSGKGSLPISGHETESIGGLFTWYENGNDYASFLWIVPLKSRYLKIRSTYIRPHGGEGNAMNSVIEKVNFVAMKICTAS